MHLKFVANNRFLEIVSANQVERQQIANVTTAKSYNFMLKKDEIRTFLHNGKYIPAGFWKAMADLNKKGYKVQIDGIKDFANILDKDEFKNWVEEQNLNYVPYDYQFEGAFLALKFPHCKNLFDTSAGKSFIIYLVCRYLLKNIFKENEKVLIVVPRTLLVDQLPNDFQDYCDDEYLVCDRIMGGGAVYDDSNVVVGNIDSLVNKPDAWFKQFGAVIIDEGHKARTESVQRVLTSLFQSKTLKYVYGMSGTFAEKEGTYDDVVETAYLGPTLRKYYVEKLREYGSVANCEMKQVRFNGGRDVSDGYYLHPEIAETQGRFIAETAYIHGIKFYRETILKLAISQEYNQALLFNTKVFCKDMAQWAKNYCEINNIDREVFVITGDTSKEERNKILAYLEKNTKCILFAMYAILDTGVSVKNLGGIHLVDSTKSVVRVRQTVGRVLRLHPDKKMAYVWDYSVHFKKADRSMPGPWKNCYSKHADERLAIYKKREFPCTIINVPFEELSTYNTLPAAAYA